MEFTKNFKPDPDHFVINTFDKLTNVEQTTAKFDYVAHGQKRKKKLREQSKYGPFDNEFDDILKSRVPTLSTYTHMSTAVDALHEEAFLDSVETKQKHFYSSTGIFSATRLEKYLGPNLTKTLNTAKEHVKPFTYSRDYMQIKIRGNSGCLWIKYFAVRLLSHCGFDPGFMAANYNFWEDFYEALPYEKPLSPTQFKRIKLAGADIGQVGYVSIRYSDGPKLKLINLAFIWPKGFENPFATTKDKALYVAGFPPSRELTFYPTNASSAFTIPQIVNEPYRPLKYKDHTFYAQMNACIRNPLKGISDIGKLKFQPYPVEVEVPPFEWPMDDFDPRDILLHGPYMYGPEGFQVEGLAYAIPDYYDNFWNETERVVYARNVHLKNKGRFILDNNIKVVGHMWSTDFNLPPILPPFERIPFVDRTSTSGDPLLLPLVAEINSPFPPVASVPTLAPLADLLKDIKTKVQGVAELPARVKKTFEGLETATSKFNKLADTVDVWVTEIKNKFSNLPSFSTLFDSIKEKFSSALTALNPFQWVVVCANLALILLYGMSSTPATRAMVAASLALLGGLTIYCHWPTTVRAHSWESVLEMFYQTFQGMGQVLLGITKDFCCWKKFSNFCGDACKVMTACQKVPEFIAFLSKCFDWLYETYHVFAYGIPSICLSDEFGALFTIAGRILAKPELYTVNIMVSVAAALDTAIKSAGKLGYGAQFDMLINITNDLRKQITISRENVFSARKGCVPPLVVFMWGKSGVGKSSIVSQVAALTSKVLLGGEITSVYYWNPTLNFMDAYFGQAVAVLDDFGQTTDVAGMPAADFLALIRAKNIAQYIVDKADLADKGNWIFSSLVLFLTSNSKVFNDANVKSCTCPSAVDRRLDIVINVTDYDQFVVERVFDKKRDDVLTSKDLVPYLIERFAEYYTHEVQVYEKIRSDLEKSIIPGANIAHQLNGDALRHFISWQNIVQDDTNSMSPEKKVFYEACSFVFDKVKKNGKYMIRCSAQDGTLNNFLEQIHDELHLPDGFSSGEEIMARLRSYAAEKRIFDKSKRYEVPVSDVCPTQAHLLATSPVVYENLGDNNQFILSTQHNCCVRHNDSYVHKDSVIDKNDYGELAVHVMTDLPFDNYCDTCAFAIIEKEYIPIYCFLNATEFIPPEFHGKLMELDMLVRKCYDCECVLDKKCLRKHKWTFPALYKNSWIRLLNLVLLANPAVVLYLKGEVPKFSEKLAPPAKLEKDKKSLDVIYKTATIATVNRGHFTLITTISALLTVILSGVVVYEQTRAWKKVIGQASNPEAVQQRTIARTPRFTPKMVISGHSTDEAVGQSFCDNRGRVDTTCHDLLSKVLTHQCKLVIWKDDEWIPILNGLFLNPRCFMTSNHVKLYMKPDTRVHVEFLYKGDTFSNFNFVWKEAVVKQILNTRGDDQVDGCIIALPKSISLPGMSTLTEKFVKVCDLNKIDGSRVLLSKVQCYNNEWSPEMWTIPTCYVHMENIDYQITKDGTIHHFHSHEWIEYEHASSPGDCASVGLIVNASLKDTGARIAFLHNFCAEAISMSGGTIYTFEQIDACMRLFGKMINYAHDIPDKYAGYAVFANCAGGSVALKGIQRPVALNYQDYHYPQHTSSETKIILSPIGQQHVLPLTKFPAHMKPFTNPQGETINPSVLALKKFLKPIYRLDRVLLDLAVDDYKCVLQGCKTFVKPEIYTLEQAVFGDENIANLKSVDVNTSDGYFWKDWSKSKGKKAWINLEKKFIHPQLREAVNKRNELGKDLILPLTVFGDCQKDEKRLPEKVDAGKTRLFSAGPIDLLLSMRMYFGAFVEWFTCNRIFNESGVGINPQSPEWHVLSKHLLRMGDHQIAGDFSDYDASEVREMLMEILEVINWWYETFGDPSPTDADVRTALFSTVIGALHLNDGYFYWVFGANPSGNYLTAVINTVYNCLFFRYAYYSAAIEAKVDYMSLPFHKTVSFMASGDDNIMGVHPVVHSFFNPSEVEKQAADIGMKYTSEAKGAIITTFRKLVDVTFLQRAFVFDRDEGMWIGPLNLDTVLNAPNWTWNDVSQAELRMSVECAIRELALYPYAVFHKWKTVLLKAAGLCKYGVLNTYSHSVYRNLMLRNAALNYAKLLDVESEAKMQPLGGLSESYKRHYPGKVMGHCASGSSTLLLNKTTLKPPLEFSSQKGLQDLCDLHGNNCITERSMIMPPIDIPDVDEIITFTEMTDSTTNSLLDFESIDTSVAAHDDPLDYTIETFLKRPKNIASGSIATTDVQGDQLLVLAFPQVFFDNAINCCKASHVRFWKMDFEVDVKFNCPATTAGSVIFFWQPVPELRGTYFVNANANAYTGLPHVIVDYNTTSNSKFTLPFVFHKAWWDIINDQSLTVVQLTMAAFNGLNGVVGTDLVKYDIYAKCTNITMGTPTYYDFQPIPMHLVDKTAAMREKNRKTDCGRVPYKFIGHSSEGIQRVKSGIETGATIGKTIGDVFDTASKLMPQLAGAAPWVADVASTLVPFGFSRPTDAAKAQPIYIAPLANMSGHNGTSQAYTLGFDCKNSIDIDRRFFGTNVDEMNIAYVISRRCLLQTISWAKTAQKGTVLWSAPVSPGFCSDSTSPQSARASHLAFAAAMHELWAGSIIYTVQVIATGFHSGRLCIFFAPGIFTLPGILAPINTQTLPRLVIDVQGSVTKEFQVKFLASTPFLQVICAAPSTSGPNFTYADINNNDVATGTVALYVENPLVGNSTVANSIDVNIFVQGGKDMNFQIPSMPNYSPAANPSPVPRAVPKGVVFQGHMISDAVPPKTNKQTGDAKAEHEIKAGKVEPKKNMVKSRKVLGDYSGVNYRAYCRIPTLIVDNDTLVSGRDLIIDPAYLDPYNARITKSRVDRIMMLYAFYRGGFEYILHPTTVGPNSNETFLLNLQFTTNATPAPISQVGGFLRNSQGFSQVVAREVTPFVAISIPFYQGGQLMGIVTDSDAGFRPILQIQYLNNADLQYGMYREARDDLDCGWLTEPPNLVLYDES